MAQSLTLKAKGLYLTSSDFEKPDGALSRADNVVISRDGVIETRRGMAVMGAKALARLFSFKDALIGHTGSVLSRSINSGAVWVDYGVPVTPPTGYPARAAPASSSMFVTDQVRPKRLDALTGTPEEAGVPSALDIDLALSSAGSPTAVPTATQVGYRVCFGRKDANGRLILGAPSARAAIANTSGSTRDVAVVLSLPQGLGASHFVQAYRTVASAAATTDPGDEMGLVYEMPVPVARTVTQLVRATNVVTATSTGHGFAAGQLVRIAPGGSDASLVVAVGVSGGTGTAMTSPDGNTWTQYAASQIKAPRSLAWSGAVFVAVGDTGSPFCATSPDGQTWTTRTLTGTTGQYAVVWTGSQFVSIGVRAADEPCAYTSPDGTTWTARPFTGGIIVGLAWSGSRLVGVGQNGSGVTSPDGVTWTAVTLPDGAGSYRGVAHNGSVFAAVGFDAAGAITAASPDGVTWSEGTSLVTASGLFAVAWSGSVFAAVGNQCAATSTDGLQWVQRTIPTGNYNGITWDGSQFVAVGTNVAATSPDGITWSAASVVPSATWRAVCGNGALFPPGEKTIATVPTTDTFTYSETGADGTLASAQTALPLTTAFVDTVPDGFIGAALYTNENQEGILAANDRPPLARELAHFAGSMFYAHVTAPAYAVVNLLSATRGATTGSGLRAGDTVIINGVTYTAAAAESVPAKEFKVWAPSDYSPASISSAIRDTAASLVRVVNRTLVTGCTITDVSTPDGVPGVMEFRNSAPTGALAVTFSRTSAWSPSSVSESPRTYKNGIVWSKPDQPDHVARALMLAPVRVGSDDEEILRVVTTRASAFVLKTDGLWRITGSGGQFDVQPFDPTIRVVGAETATQLDNTIFALSEQGVVRISDTGVAVISRPIESALLALVAPALRPTTEALAFGVGYESDRKFMLWLPTASTDTRATQAYVFDLFTGTWARRTDGYAHAFVNPADDRLYAVDGTSAWQERKTLDDTDYADRAYAVTIASGGGTATIILADASNAAVGDVVAQGAVYAVVTAKATNTLTLDRAAALTNAPASVYKAIETVTAWAPKFGASPALLTELQEIVLFWDRAYFAAASLSFATNLDPTPSALALAGSAYGWTGAAIARPEIRVWPPFAKAWGSRFEVTLTHAQAWSPNAVTGLGLLFASPSTVVSR